MRRTTSMPVAKRLFCFLGRFSGAPTPAPSACCVAGVIPGASAPGAMRFLEGFAATGACCCAAASGAKSGAMALESSPPGTPLQQEHNRHVTRMKHSDIGAMPAHQQTDKGNLRGVEYTAQPAAGEAAPPWIAFCTRDHDNLKGPPSALTGWQAKGRHYHVLRIQGVGTLGPRLDGWQPLQQPLCSLSGQ